MNNKDILDKLMSALNSFSNHDLRQLAILFKEPDVNEAIVKVIEGTLALRKAERKSKAVIKEKLPIHTNRVCLVDAE